MKKNLNPDQLVPLKWVKDQGRFSQQLYYNDLFMVAQLNILPEVTVFRIVFPELKRRIRINASDNGEILTWEKKNAFTYLGKLRELDLDLQTGFSGSPTKLPIEDFLPTLNAYDNIVLFNSLLGELNSWLSDLYITKSLGVISVKSKR